MIYLIANENDKVTLQHHKPFHEKHGLKTSREELEQVGIFVDALPPMPAPVIGINNVLYVNPLRWEPVNVPLTFKDKILKLVEDGVITQEQANDLTNK